MLGEINGNYEWSLNSAMYNVHKKFYSISIFLLKGNYYGKKIENSRISYILSVFVIITGLLWYIISDIFTLSKLTLYPHILNQIVIDLIIFWALTIILIIFSICLFLDGLRFTDNDYLKKLSNKSNQLYTFAFEISLWNIPIAISMIVIKFFNDNKIINYLFVIIYILYLVKYVSPIYTNLEKIKNLAGFMVIFAITFILIFGAFQLITADIKINFDKQYYYPDDYVIITIDKAGITHPNIYEIKIDGNIVDSENFSSSEEGTKEIVIYKINKTDLGGSNNKILNVNVNYSINLSYNWVINRNEFADFIIVK